jgi:drug/metabolite transporter (DMT)-like permease
VQSVVAITPLVIIPIARYTENERPTRGALLGCVIAVAGTIAMAIVHSHPQGFSFHF